MRLFFAIEIIPGKHSCCVSALLERILHFCISKKKKEEDNIIRTGVDCLVSPTGLSGHGQGLLIIHIIHSPSEHVFVHLSARRNELSAGL